MATAKKATKAPKAVEPTKLELDSADITDGKDGYASMVRVVTPPFAEYVLEHHNWDNRNKKIRAIDRYADDMRKGRWLLNGEAITFDTTERLVSGQNRLHACVQAGVPFDTAVVVGMDPDAQATVDTGSPRTLADLLAWRGEVNVSQLGAVMSATWRLVNGTTMSPGLQPTRQEALAVLDMNPSLRARVLDALAFKREFRTPPSAAGTVFHQLHMIDSEAASLFQEECIVGADIITNGGPFLYRRWAGKVAQLTHGRPGQTQHMAMLIKAWNLWATGETRQVLRWHRRAEGKKRNISPFPDIIDLEGLPWTPIHEVDKPAE